MYFLRELERKDVSQINKWRNNPELISFLGAPFRYINEQVDNEWFDAYMRQRNTCVRCAIVDENDYLFGTVSLVNINSTNQSATFNIMIGDLNNCSKGIGTFAVKEMLKHAFLNMNLHRVELTVLPSNKRAQAVYEKCGFIYEGTKRKCVYKNGKFEDMMIYSVLKEDYLKQGEQND